MRDFPTSIARLLRWCRNGLALLGALVLLVTITPAVRWPARWLAGHWTDADGAVLIVLGADTIKHPTFPSGVLIGESSYWRSIHAVEAWRHGHFQKVVLLGADAAGQMRQFLRAYGLPDEAIIVESASATTHENALLARPILENLPKPQVLLTSDFHMYRAARCFAKEGIQVTTRPFPDAIKRSYSPLLRWKVFCDLVGEVASSAYYQLRGWI